MTYLPLYRKWRSQNFDEIVGQEFVVQTLKNSITGKRISHAYLFSGQRGTGKTSTARIFAKALNCVKGPTPDPCGKCDQCEKIKNGHAVDVIEIDAASNRGIDEIRDLREKIRYTPIEGKYKVYIIDEVHMLTSEAFNALLKTLEEPPLHVVFILATTEPQKVPLTIASRCQRLDFRRLTNSEIISQLKKIGDTERVSIDDDAISLIARNSEGSLRDAISLFDQLISLCGQKIAHDDVIAVLGTANADLIFAFGDAMGKNDVALLFNLINRLIAEGRSIPQVTKEILMHFRNLMLVILDSGAVIEESKEHIEKLKEQSKLFSIESLKEIMRILSRAEVDMKWHPQTRLLLEVAIVEACSGRTAAPRKEQKPESKDIQVSAPKLSALREEVAAKAPTTKAPTSDISGIKAKWDEILNSVKKKNVFAYISLHEGRPESLSDNEKLVIGFGKGFAFHKGRLEEDSSRQAVEAALKEVVGRDIKIECVIETASPKPEASPSKVAELFGGKVIS